MFYKSILKPFLFLLPAEKAHHFTVTMFNLICSMPGISSIVKSSYKFEHPKLERILFGLHFKNPVGLAAGFDKDGKYFATMAHLGFGFIEIGTVTPKAQFGNPKPRLFRLPKDEALINRMGFNNDGVDAMVDRLRNRPKHIIVGGNIGKNKTTPNENAVDDYRICFEKLYDHVDYFVVNVSSPNTPNLRDLQDKKPLTEILSSLVSLRKNKSKYKAILLKIAPDLTDGQLDDIIDIVKDTNIDGVIATNTTISRANLNTSNKIVDQIGNGGLSGKLLQERSTEVIRYLSKKSGAAFPIIGVGGINGLKSAQEKLDAGASLIQVYSCMVYEGPTMVKKIKQGLVS